MLTRERPLHFAPLGTEPVECGPCPLPVLIFLGGNGSVFLTIFKSKRKQTQSLGNEDKAGRGGRVFSACVSWVKPRFRPRLTSHRSEVPMSMHSICLQCFGVCWSFQLQCWRGVEAHFMCSENRFPFLIPVLRSEGGEPLCSSAHHSVDVRSW